MWTKNIHLGAYIHKIFINKHFNFAIIEYVNNVWKLFIRRLAKYILSMLYFPSVFIFILLFLFLFVFYFILFYFIYLFIYLFLIILLAYRNVEWVEYHRCPIAIHISVNIHLWILVHFAMSACDPTVIDRPVKHSNNLLSHNFIFIIFFAECTWCLIFASIISTRVGRK